MLERRVPNHSEALYEVTSPAKACTTGSAASSLSEPKAVRVVWAAQRQSSSSLETRRTTHRPPCDKCGCDGVPWHHRSCLRRCPLSLARREGTNEHGETYLYAGFILQYVLLFRHSSSSRAPLCAMLARYLGIALTPLYASHWAAWPSWQLRKPVSTQHWWKAGVWELLMDAPVSVGSH